MGLIEVLAIGFIFMGGYLLYAFGNGHFEIKNPTVITNDGRKMEVKGTFRIYKHR